MGDLHFDALQHDLVAVALRPQRRQPFARQTEALPVLRARRDLQIEPPRERRHLYLRSQRRLGKADRKPAQEILPVPLEERMGFYLHVDVQVAPGPAVGTRLALPRRPRAQPE